MPAEFCSSGFTKMVSLLQPQPGSFYSQADQSGFNNIFVSRSQNLQENLRILRDSSVLGMRYDSYDRKGDEEDYDQLDLGFQEG